MTKLHTERLLEQSRATLRDPQLQQALQSAADRLRLGRETAFAELGERGEELRRRGQAIRQRTMAHLDQHLDRLARSVEKAGGVVHWAGDGQEVCRIVAGVARERGVRLAVKSKSMTTEEINLREALEEDGVEVIETDLGERIVQLAGERPYHILAPAFHKTRHQVADLFTTVGHDGDAGIAVLNQFARRHLREKFIAADMGISGVNFAVAETGTLILVTNEGNGRLVTGLPRIHVAVMGVEKVVPTWEDVTVLLQILARSATGQKQSTYVTCVTGPRRPGQPDGPEELHLVIMDNGRSRILGSPFREALHCIRCGACFNVCPVYREIGGHAYGSIYSGPIGSVLTPLLQGLDDFAALPQASSLCGACLEACPVYVDIPRMLLALREQEVERRQGSRAESLAFRLYAWVAGHPTLFRLAARLGYVLQRPFVRDGRIGRAPFPLSRWTAFREFPALAARPFRDRWEELQKPWSRLSSLLGQTGKSAPHPPGQTRSESEVTSEVDTEEMVARMKAELEKVGGLLYRMATVEEARQFIIGLACERGVRRAVLCGGPDLAELELEEALRTAGITVAGPELEPEALRQAMIEADMGISGVDYAIAETGTLVLVAGPELPRNATALPPIHLAVMRPERLVLTFEAATALLKQRLLAGDGTWASSCVTFITGPSRTADIEQSLTIGVHGPGEVHVIVVDYSSRNNRSIPNIRSSSLISAAPE